MSRARVTELGLRCVLVALLGTAAASKFMSGAPASPLLTQGTQSALAWGELVLACVTGALAGLLIAASPVRPGLTRAVRSEGGDLASGSNGHELASTRSGR